MSSGGQGNPACSTAKPYSGAGSSSGRDPMRHTRARSSRLVAAIVALSAVAPAGREAAAADFVLANETGLTINELYVSPCSGRHWGPNQLTGTYVESSRAYVVSNLVPGCYDLKVVMPPWNACIINGVAIFKSLVLRMTWNSYIESTFDDCSRMAHMVPVGRRQWIPYDRPN
jgi:hypothetical protein